LTKDRSALLDKLVSDCVTFSLHLDESLEYIGKNFGPISTRTYFRRRSKVTSEESINAWLSYFTRIGFVELHKRLTDTIENLMEDSVIRLYEEEKKQIGNRNENLILSLKKDIKENSKLLIELGTGTPIVASMKSRLDKARARLGHRCSTMNPEDEIN
jgi:hypothetical protein